MKEYTFEEIMEFFNLLKEGKMDAASVGYALAFCKEGPAIIELVEKEANKRKKKNEMDN